MSLLKTFFSIWPYLDTSENESKVNFISRNIDLLSDMHVIQLLLYISLVDFVDFHNIMKSNG